MKPLPLPVRVAAGLAVTAVDRARHLPEKLAGLPVTMVSQALQLSMRLQQQMTELAIKGDDALSTLRPVEESPEWATFDEDAVEGQYDASSTNNVTRSRFDATDADSETDGIDGIDTAADVDAGAETVVAADPWAAEERAMLHELDNDHTAASRVETTQIDPAQIDPAQIDPAQIEPTPVDSAEPPTALPDYADLTLPQVRARMRRLSIEQLTELVEYERVHEDRPAFVGMLSRRIGTLRDQQ
jgi:hypothetical protein